MSPKSSPMPKSSALKKAGTKTGMSRESMYKALSSEGNPSFATVLKVARALGVTLHATAA